MEAVIRQLVAMLGRDGVLEGEDVSSRSAGVWGDPGPIRAAAILRPQTTQQVSDILRLCNEQGCRVVPQGGLSGVVGGSETTPQDIVISLERMQAIEELDIIGRTMTVQAGAILQNLQDRAAEAGFLLPLDLGARGSCTIGGNIATNAGGNRVIRYGMTRNIVLGLEAVLADGTIVSSMNHMIKNNAGYDLKHLFIGSEGTLGVVTRAVLRLQERPLSQNTAFASFSSFDQVPAFLKLMDNLLGGTLSAFEIMWQDFYNLVTTAPARSKPPIEGQFPFYVLVEGLGGHVEDDERRFRDALTTAFEKGLIEDAVFAESQAQKEAMWAIRDDVEQALQYDPVYVFDVSLAIKDMENYAQRVQGDLRKTGTDFKCFIFGHMGDGNLHLMIASQEPRHKIESIVYNPISEISGSVSAEHGVGLEKKSWLHLCRSPEEINLMRLLKKSLDPKNILNPGKIFDLK